MSHRIRCSLSAMSTAFFAVACALPAHAATPSDQAEPARELPAKRMMKKEPMMGEMKKDGMMKEDVGKAAKQWDEKMKETMKKEQKQ